MKRRACLAAIVAAFALTACSQEAAAPPAAPQAPTIRIENLRIAPVLPGRNMTAAYFTMRNESDAPDRLRAVAAVGARASLHETRADEHGVTRMIALANGVEAPAHAEVSFVPGGLHVMLEELVAPLSVGDRVVLTVSFERAGDITVEGPVVPASEIAGAATPSGDHAHP